MVSMLRVEWLLLVLLFTACGTPPAVGQSEAPLESTHTLTLPGWDTGVPALEVPVPEGYTARTENGRDFDIHFLKPPSDSAALGSIYVGQHPNLLHRQLGVVGDVAEHSETLGGKAVAVYQFSIDGPRIVREATLTSVYANSPADERLDGLQVHISVTGATSADVDALWKYISRVHRSNSSP